MRPIATAGGLSACNKVLRALQKQLNRLISHLGYGPWLAQGTVLDHKGMLLGFSPHTAEHCSKWL